MGYHHGGQIPPGGHTSTHNWRTRWDDQRHPKIKEMMHSYLVLTNGHIHLAEILNAVGRWQNDLPTLSKYVHPSGQPFLCWSSVLGRCMFRDCCFCKEGGIHFRWTSLMSSPTDALMPFTRASLLLAGTREAHQTSKSKGLTATPPRSDIKALQVGAQGIWDHLSNRGVMGCNLRRTKAR